ncbi:SIS domain-containing protein [Oscillospiraceae bacterium CM]|nr:SIS domain-containing protein [Oscillospiraceae bacterium CM]
MPLLKAVEAAADAFKSGGKLLVCGNGGSAADAQHIVGELMKSFVLPRTLTPGERELLQNACPHGAYLAAGLQRALPAVSLVGETSLITACANDNGADLVFAQQVFGYGRRGDVLLALTTSGCSQNVLYACEVAAALGMTVIAFTGETGGFAREIAHILVNVPAQDAFRVQNLHTPAYHLFCLAVENELFGA